MSYVFRGLVFYVLSLCVAKVNKMPIATCDICGKELVSGEALFCASCVAFLEWKYGSLEAYQKEYNQAVRRPKP